MWSQLPGLQNELATAILQLGKPVLVVLLNGRPYSVNYLAEHAQAILEGCLIRSAGLMRMVKPQRGRRLSFGE